MDHTPETPAYSWADLAQEVGAELASSLTPQQTDELRSAVAYHLRNFVEPTPAVATDTESSES
jgi:hypothetical protein